VIWIGCEQVTRRAARTTVGADVTTMSRSQATRVQPSLPAVAAHGHQAIIMHGGMSTAERRANIERPNEAKAGDGSVVIGTTPFIGEGFDAPALDTLFLAGPISYDGLLVQCAGRVVRSAPDKDVVEVHDYHDAATPVLAASLNRRMPGYRALGFTRR
jgi:superfamily II DNA or RNA helicase